MRISVARHRIFHSENFDGASLNLAHFPHCDENFGGASSMFAHFPHYGENFSDASSKFSSLSAL